MSVNFRCLKDFRYLMLKISALALPIAVSIPLPNEIDKSRV